MKNDTKNSDESITMTNIIQAVDYQATALYHELEMLANQERSDAIMGIRRGPSALGKVDDRERVAAAYSMSSSRLDQLRELIRNIPSS